MSKWQFRDASTGPAPAEWAGKLAITPLLLEILWRRGLRDLDVIDEYLTAPLKKLPQPSVWPAITEAAEILATALLAGKKLAIWGDYDVDGITATALALDILETHGFEVMHHLPDRRSEGYGLNVRGIEELAEAGCQALLTVDCGISDGQAIGRARELGLTVVVSDHHLPSDTLPPAHGIVNPRLAGAWSGSQLAGVGVAFYLLAATNVLLAPHTGKRYKMDDALDLVSLGTLADVMPLEGENRILVRAGLTRLGNAARPGISALKLVSRMDRAASLNSDQAVFKLAPRINAAGRMGDPELALKLLRARDAFDADQLAQKLDERNEERKAEEKRIFNEARNQAQELLQQQDYAGLVLFGADWHPGIVGIVASRIVEAFNRPAIVLCRDGAALKGSGRSIGDFDLHAGLLQASDCLLGFGGHHQAAGVKLEETVLDEFREAFHAICREAIGPEPAEPVLVLDGELDFRQASNHKFLRELELMQPLGPGNPEPIFSSPPLLVRRRTPLGHTGEHVTLEVKDEKSGYTLYAKAWRRAAEMGPELENSHIRLAYTPRLDMYNGLPRIDLVIRDWRKA